MRICYLADGQSIHTKRWCDHFSKLGHDIHLITFREAEVENTTVHYVNPGNISVKGGNWKVLLKIGELKKILGEIKPHILHAHYATSYGIAGALCNYHPYIITALGSDVLISPQRSFLYRKLVTYALKKAEWVTAMANHMQEEIIKLGINPGKVATVIFGIDPKIFNHNDRKIPKEQFVITSTRNFEPIYNIELLINAIQLIKDKIPGLSVNLIGEGSQRIKLEKMIDTKGLNNVVKFHGKIAQKDIAKTLNQSHLFVTTSLSDGNNVSLNEAMACGAFSLATDIPANKQWIKEGINGFLIPTDNPQILADKILYVYQNYTDLEKASIPFNDKIIAQKALWTANMELVEKKYKKLFRNSLKQDLIVIGSDDKAKEVAAAAAYSFNVIGFADDNIPVGTEVVKGIKIIGSEKEFEKTKASATHYITPFGNHETRKNIFHSFAAHLNTSLDANITGGAKVANSQHNLKNSDAKDKVAEKFMATSLVDSDKEKMHFFINS